MPQPIERKLKLRAARNPDIKDKGAYVYGTLRKTGWTPQKKKEPRKAR